MGDTSSNTSERFRKYSNLAKMLRHDIDNPLFAIIGYAEMMREDAGGNSQSAEVAEHITHRGNRIKKTLDRFARLDFSTLPEEEDAANWAIDFAESLLKRASGAIITYSSALEQYCEKAGREVVDERIGNIERASARIKEVAKSTSAGNLKELCKDFGYVNVTEKLLSIIGYYVKKPEIRKDGIGVRFHYNIMAPMKTIKGDALCEITNALMSNACEYAPAGSTVELGVTKKESSLEIITESTHNGFPARKSFGHGHGKGLAFVRGVVDEIKGDYCVINKAQINPSSYKRVETFGNQDAVEKGTKVYSAKIAIPTR